MRRRKINEATKKTLNKHKSEKEIKINQDKNENWEHDEKMEKVNKRINLRKPCEGEEEETYRLLMLRRSLDIGARPPSAAAAARYS